MRRPFPFVTLLPVTRLACAGTVAVSVTVGCTELLDMPEPNLCLACADGSVIVPTQDAPTAPADQASPPIEATPSDDAGPGPEAMPSDDARAQSPFRCGGGTAGPATECTPPDVCCHTVINGVGQYTCGSEISCPKAPPATYPIECAGPEDCTPGNICCHFRKATVCVAEFLDGAPGDCLNGLHNGDVVCDPDASMSTCPMGSCTYPLGSDMVYYGCWAPP